MRLEVVPGERIGAVRLGMSRREVVAAVGESPVSFERAGSEVDAFQGNALQVFYSAEALVDYVEASAAPGVTATLDNLDVFGTPAAHVVDMLSAQAWVDESDPESGYSYRYPALGLALWRPTLPGSPEDPDGRYFSTVGVMAAAPG